MTQILDMPNLLSDEVKRQWSRDSIVRRAEFGGKVYELSLSGKVYVLRRTSSAPSKPNQVGFLDLIEVINEPDMQLRVKINDHAEPYPYNADLTHY